MLSRIRFLAASQYLKGDPELLGRVVIGAKDKRLIPKNGISKHLAIATQVLISSIGNRDAFVKGKLIYSGFLARGGGWAPKLDFSMLQPWSGYHIIKGY
jgi:hypothetical protein